MLGRRAHQPERREGGEFLAGWQTCVDRDAASRQAPRVLPAHRTEVACAGEDQELVLFVISSKGVGQLESRVTQIGRYPPLQFRVGELKELLFVRQKVNTLRIDHMDIHRVCIKETGRKQHHLQPGATLAPETVRFVETDALIGVVVDLTQKPGDGFGRIVRLSGQGLRTCGEVLETEGACVIHRGQRRSQE
jgi:hypothetical protein